MKNATQNVCIFSASPHPRKRSHLPTRLWHINRLKKKTKQNQTRGSDGANPGPNLHAGKAPPGRAPSAARAPATPSGGNPSERGLRPQLLREGRSRRREAPAPPAAHPAGPPACARVRPGRGGARSPQQTRPRAPRPREPRPQPASQPQMLGCPNLAADRRRRL